MTMSDTCALRCEDFTPVFICPRHLAYLGQKCPVLCGEGSQTEGVQIQHMFFLNTEENFREQKGLWWTSGKDVSLSVITIGKSGIACVY